MIVWFKTLDLAKEVEANQKRRRRRTKREIHIKEKIIYWKLIVRYIYIY